MIEIKPLTEYTPETAQTVRELLIELSRSSKDKGEIPREWFEDVIKSDYHDLLLAYDDEKIVGMTTVSVTNGAGARKSVYIEDFVVSNSTRGKGAGTALWNAMADWGRQHGCNKMMFTCGNGREASQEFYKKRGAEIYETNFFKFDL